MTYRDPRPRAFEERGLPIRRIGDAPAERADPCRPFGYTFAWDGYIGVRPTEEQLRQIREAWARRRPVVSLKTFKRQVRRERLREDMLANPLARALHLQARAIRAATGHAPNARHIPIGATTWRKAVEGDERCRLFVEATVGSPMWHQLPWRQK